MSATLTPAAPTTPDVVSTQRRFDTAAETEQSARVRWEAAASALVRAQQAATGPARYVQSAYLWDHDTDLTAIPVDHRADIARLAQAEATARADRDRAGTALVLARQALHTAQLAAQREWLAS